MQLTELKLNPNNPQLFDDLTKLENSIKEFPKMMELRPLVVDSDNVVLGGNKRLICLQNLGYKEIPETWVKQAEKLTEEEQKRFIIADNVGFGEWDWEMLQTDFDVEELAEWGLEKLDFEGGGIDEDEGKDPFDDEGIDNRNQFGVIVMCENGSEQEKVFNSLSNDGYTCKIVVT